MRGRKKARRFNQGAKAANIRQGASSGTASKTPKRVINALHAALKKLEQVNMHFGTDFGGSTTGKKTTAPKMAQKRRRKKSNEQAGSNPL